MNFKLGLFALAAFLAVQASGTELEDRAIQLIEDFRSTMATGRPDIHIPVLEPVTIKKLPLNIKFSPFDAKVVASNIIIAGISAFKFTKISQIEGTNKLALEVEVPSVNVNGAYDIDGKVKISFFKVKLNGDGPVKLTVNGIKAQATVDVVTNPDGSLFLSELKVGSWSYDSVKIQLDNLFHGGAMGKTVNALINKLVPAFIKGIHSKIDHIAETIGLMVVNQYLRGTTGKHSVRLLAVPYIASEEITLQDHHVGAEAREILDQLVLLAASSVSVSTDLEDRVTQLIEEFRSTMATGHPDIDIPVTDPAFIKEIPISVKLSPFDAKAIGSNIQVAGVSAFEFTKLSQIEGTNKLSLAVDVPEIHVTGQYDVDGKVKIGFIKLPLKSQGPLALNIKGLKVEATVDVLVNDDGSLNLKTLQVDSWTYDKITIQLDNLFNGGAMGKTVNALINKLVPTFVNMNRSKFTQIAEKMGTPFINKYLDGVNGKTRRSLRILSASAPAPHLELALEDFAVSSEARKILDQLAIMAVNARLAIAA